MPQRTFEIGVAKPAKLDVHSQETQQRLIEAGGEVFAERGYERATVREIVSRAGANIAAVNYHFGDKFALYNAVLRHFAHLGVKQYPPDFGIGPDADPHVQLYAYIRSFFLRMFDPGKPAYVSRLILREMIDPTPALDERVRDMMQPMLGVLKRVIGLLVSRPLDEEEMFHACTSIMGQITLHRHCTSVVSRLFPKEATYDTDMIDRLARHVTEFSLAGLQQLESRGRGK